MKTKMEGLPESSEKRARLEQVNDDDEQADTANLVVLVDQSGSMEAQRDTMVPAVERMLRHMAQETPTALREEKSAQVYFFSVACEKKLSLTFAGILAAPEGLGLEYNPEGSTALFNSIVAVLPHVARKGTLFIATDGENTVEDGPETQESCKRALALAKDAAQIKVLALTEGKEALAQARVMEMEVMQSARGYEAELSQGMGDAQVLGQISQSLLEDYSDTL